MDKPVFSIIVPVYNTPEPLLKECLQSLMDQSFSAIEVILVDDGSTNAAPAICDDYAAVDERITVVHQMNQGVSTARNNGLARAQGEWVSFVDPDDWVDNRMCEAAQQAIAQTERDIYIFPYWQDNLVREISKYKGNSGIDLDLAEVEKIQLAVMDSNDEFVPHLIGSSCAKVYNRQFLDKNAIRFKENLSMSEDLIFTLYAFEQTDKIGYVDFLFYHYRTNADSVTKKYRPNIWGNIDNSLAEAQRFIENGGKDKAFKQAYHHLATKLLKDNLMLDFFNENNPKSYSERKKEFIALIKRPPYRESLKKINLENSAKKKKVSIYLLKYRQFFLLSKYYSHQRKRMLGIQK